MSLRTLFIKEGTPHVSDIAFNIISSRPVLCRDAVVLQHTYEIFSRSVELSVHDNVLLVHHLDSSTVLLLDVRARSNGPIAGPLPLAIALEDQVEVFTLLPLQPLLEYVKGIAFGLHNES